MSELGRPLTSLPGEVGHQPSLCCCDLCTVPSPLSFSPQALGILMLPHNILPSLNLLTSMVDDMWHYAGDQSTDVSASAGPRDTEKGLG